MTLTRFLHSRQCALLTAAAASAWAALLGLTGNLPAPAGFGGLVEAWRGPWDIVPQLSAWLGAACTLLVVLLLIAINRTFNLLRDMTGLQATAFVVLQAAAPAAMAHLCMPMLTVGVTLCAMFLLFDTYAEPEATPTVFLVFFILSLGAALDVLFIGLTAVFFLGVAQMRVFSLRSVSAMLLGAVTPWLILLGFGIVAPSGISWPHVHAAQGGSLLLPLALAASLSALVLIGAWVQNLMKYLTYNAHSRAMLSMATALSLATVVFTAAGFSNLYACLPLLDMCAALQLAHLFAVVHKRRKSYIAILCIFLPFILLAVWTTILCI